jgi:hypothetical protein
METLDQLRSSDNLKTDQIIKQTATLIVHYIGLSLKDVRDCSIKMDSKKDSEEEVRAVLESFMRHDKLSKWKWKAVKDRYKQTSIEEYGEWKILTRQQISEFKSMQYSIMKREDEFNHHLSDLGKVTSLIWNETTKVEKLGKAVQQNVWDAPSALWNRLRGATAQQSETSIGSSLPVSMSTVVTIEEYIEKIRKMLVVSNELVLQCIKCQTTCLAWKWTAALNEVVWSAPVPPSLQPESLKKLGASITDHIKTFLGEASSVLVSKDERTSLIESFKNKLPGMASEWIQELAKMDNNTKTKTKTVPTKKKKK